MPRGRSLSRRARTALAWGLFWFIASQAALRLTLQVRPEIADREFGRKLSDLRRQTAENPGRPLVLMFGSSRVATGFRPAILSPFAPSAAQDPLVFNFAQVGSGPEMAHLSLHRLLESGIRPEWVFIEFWPPTWGTERTLKEFSEQINIDCLGWNDVELLGKYVSRPRRLYRAWLATQATPLFANRLAILAYAMPGLFGPGVADRRCQNLDSLGWWSPTKSIAPEEHRRLVDRYRRIYEPRLRKLQIAKSPDRALRAMLALCRRERIRATVVVLPEGTDFRVLYPEAALRAVDAYLTKLRVDERVSVVDARTWVSDAGFIDGHHLLPGGAGDFTRRLARDVLEPQLAEVLDRMRR